MKERPILLKSEMVRAILDGRKTQTRRIVKLKPIETDGFTSYRGDALVAVLRHCPYGTIGDHLWVRETHSILIKPEEATNGIGRAWYYATSEDQGIIRWKPSIHMPRWASRILLEVVSVRVERLQDISEADAIAEGIQYSQELEGYHVEDGRHYHATTAVRAYESLWETINGHGSWELNPWVWVIEFKRVKP